jgi:hypothetical protein
MQYNALKARKLVVWILQQLKEPAIPYIWPIIYLTERKYLAIMGKWMLEDTYVAMRNGPVPLQTFASLHLHVDQSVRFRTPMAMDQWLKRLVFSSKQAPLLSEFTIVEQQCMREAIAMVKRLGLRGVECLVRGPAWRMARQDGLLDPLEIAREVDADAAVLDAILRWREPPYLLEVGAASG